jgi:hypothetical protein
MAAATKVTAGKQVSANLASGIDACRPVQMALRSYWQKEIVSAAQIDAAKA